MKTIIAGMLLWLFAALVLAACGGGVEVVETLPHECGNIESGATSALCVIEEHPNGNPKYTKSYSLNDLGEWELDREEWLAETGWRKRGCRHELYNDGSSKTECDDGTFANIDNVDALIDDFLAQLPPECEQDGRIESLKAKCVMVKHTNGRDAYVQTFYVHRDNQDGSRPVVDEHSTGASFRVELQETWHDGEREYAFASCSHPYSYDGESSCGIRDVWRDLDTLASWPALRHDILTEPLLRDRGWFADLGLGESKCRYYSAGRYEFEEEPMLECSMSSDQFSEGYARLTRNPLGEGVIAEGWVFHGAMLFEVGMHLKEPRVLEADMLKWRTRSYGNPATDTIRCRYDGDAPGREPDCR